MKTIDQEALKTIQLEVLDAFDRYCQANGFRYSISCGTLLGAVRHGGYIPWDDDIDVCMLRKDYQRLMASFPELFEARYKMGEISRNRQWDCPYAKMYDTLTVMKENCRESVEKGVNIDIFPIDRLPVDISERSRHVKRCSMLYKLFNAKKRKLCSKREWWKTPVLLIIKLLLFPWSTQAFCRRIDIELQRWNVSGSTLLADLDAYCNLTRTFDADLFDKLEDIQFEGHRYKAFADFKTYLTAMYGDYMQLPPAEQRCSHHKFEAFYKD